MDLASPEGASGGRHVRFAQLLRNQAFLKTTGFFIDQSSGNFAFKWHSFLSLF
jgi:hypothetical protein